MVDVDVVIIGGGFAGLSAAIVLSEKSVKCLIVERRSRLGGRTLSKQTQEKNYTIDLGGQWIGPLQIRVLSLIELFDLQSIEQTWHHSDPNHLGQAIGLEPLTEQQSLNDGLVGAQHYKICSGSQSIYEKLSTDENLLYNDPLRSIDYRIKDQIVLTLHSSDRVSQKTEEGIVFKWTTKAKTLWDSSDDDEEVKEFSKKNGTNVSSRTRSHTPPTQNNKSMKSSPNGKRSINGLSKNDPFDPSDKSTPKMNQMLTRHQLVVQQTSPTKKRKLTSTSIDSNSVDL